MDRKLRFDPNLFDTLQSIKTLDSVQYYTDGYDGWPQAGEQAFMFGSSMASYEYHRAGLFVLRSDPHYLDRQYVFDHTVDRSFRFVVDEECTWERLQVFLMSMYLCNTNESDFRTHETWQDFVTLMRSDTFLDGVSVKEFLKTRVGNFGRPLYSGPWATQWTTHEDAIDPEAREVFSTYEVQQYDLVLNKQGKYTFTIPMQIVMHRDRIVPIAGLFASTFSNAKHYGTWPKIASCTALHTAGWKFLYTDSMVYIDCRERFHVWAEHNDEERLAATYMSPEPDASLLIEAGKKANEAVPRISMPSDLEAAITGEDRVYCCGVKISSCPSHETLLRAFVDTLYQNGGGFRAKYSNDSSWGLLHEYTAWEHHEYTRRIITFRTSNAYTVLFGKPFQDLLDARYDDDIPTTESWLARVDTHLEPLPEGMVMGTIGCRYALHFPEAFSQKTHAATFAQKLAPDMWPFYKNTYVDWTAYAAPLWTARFAIGDRFTFSAQVACDDRMTFLCSPWCQRESVDNYDKFIDIYVGDVNSHTLMTWLAGPGMLRLAYETGNSHTGGFKLRGETVPLALAAGQSPQSSLQRHQRFGHAKMLENGLRQVTTGVNLYANLFTAVENAKPTRISYSRELPDGDFFGLYATFESLSPMNAVSLWIVSTQFDNPDMLNTMFLGTTVVPKKLQKKAALQQALFQMHETYKDLLFPVTQIPDDDDLRNIDNGFGAARLGQFMRLKALELSNNTVILGTVGPSPKQGVLGERHATLDVTGLRHAWSWFYEIPEILSNKDHTASAYVTPALTLIVPREFFAKMRSFINPRSRGAMSVNLRRMSAAISQAMPFRLERKTPTLKVGDLPLYQQNFILNKSFFTS